MWGHSCLSKQFGTCQISACQIQSPDGMGHGVSLVDWHEVRHPVSCIQNYASRSSRRVQRHHRLDTHIHGRTLELLKHYFRHALSVRCQLGILIRPISYILCLEVFHC